MIKTLYVRVVLTYVAAVTVGLVVAYFSTMFVATELGEKYLHRLHQELARDGVEIAELFRTKGIHTAAEEMKTSDYGDKYVFRLYDSEAKLLPVSSGAVTDLYIISEQEVRYVLDGGEFKGYDVAPSELVVGIPIKEDGEPFALFVEISQSALNAFFSIVIIVALVVNFLIGSLIIIVGARYLVRPLRGMKAAAERMARGEFDIQLQWSKRKDELGQLAHSFNYMASQMQQLETMRQTFVSNVSHEIQSPLTSISGFSKALQHRDLPDEDRIRYLSIIQQESERLSRLSENLLRLASLDSEHHPFEPRTYDLDEQIRKVIVACEPQWSDKSIQWQLELPATKMKADEDQLNQVWQNLIGNSIKFTPEGGCIGIHIVQFVDSIQVVLSDNGIGIPAEDQPKVFERFYKADKSHNKNKSGNGLGLAIVHKIVALHQGSIVLKSQSGIGTQVIVTLPHT